MSFMQTISDIIELIFKHSSPDVQKKQQLKKLETEIKEYNPIICKMGKLHPNFGEAIYGLYKYTRPLDNLYSATVSPIDIQRQHRFEAQLIITAYSPENQKALESLSYQNRKDEILAEASNPERVYIHQKQIYERLIRELKTDVFKKIDKDILTLRQLVELCRYNFVPFLQIFDDKFRPADISYTPNFTEVVVSKAENLLEDLYYQASTLQLNTTTAEMTLALAKLKQGSELSPEDRKLYIGSIKKINYILKKVIPPERIKTILKQSKEDMNYEPSVATYTGSPRQEFANLLLSRFESDEKRIKSEIQDATITEEIVQLFGNSILEEIGEYNQKNNMELQSETPFSFQWILPLKLLKTFLKVFLPEPIKNLLNNIVIEGFFNNPSYKTSLSSIVYSVINAEDDISAFENLFNSDQKYSIAVIQSYILDGRKDKDFYSRLEKLVHNINEEAHRLLQTEVTYLCNLSRELDALLADAKKPSSEIIQNLKVLVFSSRNRDQASFLEENFEKWQVFFDIMKNYVIITGADKGHE